MAIKVLIVDDSTFFRKRLTEIIKADPTLEVIGEAKDGKEGVDKTMSLHPDVITMDVEMPVMDGITAVQQIMEKCPTPILMFSSLTFEGANSTFKALEAGAVDFMPKNFDDIAHKREDALNTLRNSIKAVARSHIRRTPMRSSSAASTSALSSSSRPATSTLGRTSSTLGSRSSVGSSTTSSSLGRTSTTSSLGSRSTLGSSSSSLRSSSTSSSSLSRTSSLGRSSAPSAGGALPSTVRQDLDQIYERLSGVNQGRPAAAMQFSFGKARGVYTNFKVSGKTVPIVCGAVIFDLNEKETYYPDIELGYKACAAASDKNVAFGAVGVGKGATVGKLRGMKYACTSGVGAATVKAAGAHVTAVVAVIALGDVFDPEAGKIVAGCRNRDGSFAFAEKKLLGGEYLDFIFGKGNTTIGCVITDAKLDKLQTGKLASVAHNGLARTGSRPVVNFALLQAAAVKAVERAVIDAVSGSVATEAGFELSDEE